MKKLLNVMLVMVLGFVTMVPMSAKAIKLEVPQKAACVTNENGKCVYEYAVKVTENAIPITSFEIEYTFTNLEFVSFEGKNGWTGNFDNGVLKLSNSTPVGDANIDFGTIKVQLIDNTKNCNLKIGLPDAPATEITVEVEQQVETGVSLPLIILGAGIVIAGVVYYVTRKNTKLYKI